MEVFENDFLDFYRDCLYECCTDVLAHKLACEYVAGKFGMTKERAQSILDYLGYHLPPTKWTNSYE